MIKLYKRDARGLLNFWQVEAGDQELIIQWGVEGGEVQTQYEEVEFGKGTRDEVEQMESRMQSRANKKRDAGYVESREHALKYKAVNALGLPHPMKAKRLDQVKDFSFQRAFVQLKYDGHRCMIARRGNEMIAYSRNGKRITSVNPILRNLDIPDGMILDGELYHHGTPLQTISSWVRRSQPSSERLTYICYDTINPDLGYKDRLHLLIDTLKNIERVEIAPTLGSITKGHLKHLMQAARNDGYEGLIIRLDGTGYEDGKRSRNLIKVKEWLDNEFKIIGTTVSRDGWAILRCTTDDGNIFTVSAPGTVEEKTEALTMGLVGKFVRVEYACLTKDGVPFHPVATNYVE